MPLQVLAGTAPDASDDTSVDYLSSFEALPRKIAGHFNERTHPDIVSDRLASSARQFTVAIDRLGRQLDELKGAGVGDSGRDGLMEAVRALQGEFARGHTSASKTLDAHKAIGGMHGRLTRDWDRLNDGQKALVDGISKQLAQIEDIANRAAPRLGPSRTGRVARAVADKHGLGDHFDAVFAPKADRHGDDYRSSFARLARVAAGRRGYGDLFDAAFKANPGARPRRVNDAVAARRAADAADRAFIGPRAPLTALGPKPPAPPAGHPTGPDGGDNVLDFIKPVQRGTNVSPSTQAIPVIPIGKNDDKVVSSLDGLNKNVIRLNDQLDRDHRQRLNDYERRRQEQFDHDQSLYGKRDAGASHGVGGALAAAAAAHARDGEHGGGWLTDLVHSVVEGGVQAEVAAAAGGAGGLAAIKRMLGRGKTVAKGAGKGAGWFARFLRHGKGKAGLLAGAAVGAGTLLYGAFHADSAQAAEHPQEGEPGVEPEGRRPEGSEKEGVGFKDREALTTGVHAGVESTVDRVAEHYAEKREAAEHARKLAARPSPEKAAADFAARQRALVGESPAAHAARLASHPPVGPSDADLAVDAVTGGEIKAARAAPSGGRVEAPVSKGVKAAGSGFEKEVASAAGNVVKGRTGVRVASSAAKTLGKGLLKALGPLGVILQVYDGWEQLSDLYGMRKNGEISEDEFNTEFYAIIARMAAGPAGAAIGAELGALGGAAAGAPIAGVGAVPGALIGGFIGSVAGYFSGAKLADAAVHKVLDKAKPAIDAEIDARTKEKTTPSETLKKDGPKPGDDGAPKNAMGGPGGGVPEGDHVTQPAGPGGGNGAGAAGGGGAAWDGATSHTIGGVGHQGEVRHASDAFKGSGSRRAGRGVSSVEGVYTGDTARPGGGKVTPSDQIGPGGGSDIDWSAAILRKKEGFQRDAKWDVNHHRLGYGSDTITDAQGNVREVRAGDSVTQADAERDLRRRMPQFQAKLRTQVGAEAWDRLDPATKGALTSVGYNYGSFGKLKSLTAAVRSGDKAQIANAVRALQGHNGGVNRQRRLDEASIIESGHLPGSWRMQDPGSTVPGQPPTPGNDNQRLATTPSSPAGPGGTPMSGGSPPGGGSGNVQATSPGPIDPKKQLDHLQEMRRRGMITDQQCVTLAMAGVGIQKGQGVGGNVHDWRKGAAASSGQLPIGTPVATFKDDQGRDSDRYAGGGIGTPGAHKDHAGLIAGYRYDKAGNVTAVGLAEQYQGSQRKYGQSGVGVNYYPVGNRNARGPEDDGANYHAVLDRRGNPLGGDNNPMSPGFGGAQPAGGTSPALAAGMSPQGPPAGPAAPRGADTPQVPGVRPTDKVFTGWDPGMRSSYDAAATPQVPGAKADPSGMSAYDPKPSQPGPDGKADPGLRSAYDAPAATRVDQPTDVPVQAAKTSAAITAASAPAAPGGDGGDGASGGGSGDRGEGGSGGGGGYCRCTAGTSGGGKMDGFGDSPMSPLLAMMNSTLFNRG